MVNSVAVIAEVSSIVSFDDDVNPSVVISSLCWEVLRFVEDDVVKPTVVFAAVSSVVVNVIDPKVVFATFSLVVGLVVVVGGDVIKSTVVNATVEGARGGMTNVTTFFILDLFYSKEAEKITL